MTISRNLTRPLTNGVSRALTAATSGSPYGPELISGAGTGSLGWTVSAGTITRNGASGGQAAMVESAEPGATYRVAFSVTDLSGDTFFNRCGGTLIQNITANGDYVFEVVAANDGALFMAAPWGGSAGQATISGISVRRKL